jgi:Domain of Unknown Function (DUF1206)
METLEGRVQAAVPGRAGAEPRRGLVLLARAGLVARGVLYVLIGALAVDVSQGQTGANASQQGAVQNVAKAPFGHWLLIALAIGVFGYAIWRAVQALTGDEIETGERRGATERIGAGAAAVAYFAIFAMILGILLGSSSGGGSFERFTKWAMGISPWLVGAAGAILIAVGLHQAVKGLRRSFMKKMKGGLGATARRWVSRLGLVGYVARGIVFGLVGYGLVQAARTYDPQKARGLDGSLQKVLHEHYGALWVALVAAGLIAFGLFSLVESRYRRV